VGDSVDAESHEPYAPSELSFLRTSGYDYWALGHVHVRQELSDRPPVHYPGNPQGRNPRETGAKGALLVDLSRKDSPGIDFIELGPVRWETLRIGGLEEVRHLPGLARHIEGEWRRVRGQDVARPGTRWIARFELEGASPLHGQLVSEETRAELRDALASGLGLLDVDVRTDGVRSLERVEDHLGRDDVLGETLRLIRNLAEGGESPSATLALSADQMAHRVDPRELDAYIRELLEGGDADLLDALLWSADR
jgi:DNA repair exonuclease SbcCD nuclease subunit